VTDDAPLSVEDVRAVLDRAHDAWDAVVDRASVTARALRIADVDVDVVVAGDDLAAVLLPALDGLAAADGPARGTVGAWDAAATGVGFPARPGTPDTRPLRCLVRRDGRPVAEVEWPSEGALRTADRDARLHLLAVGSPPTIAPWEAGVPLRRQLSWALGPEVQFVHAAAVGGPDGVALMMGPGGSGKSSTALACLQAGMGFLSDDYCLVRDEPPVAHRLHATARVFDHDVPRFRGLSPALMSAPVAPSAAGERPKALFLLQQSRPDAMLASAPVRVLLVLEPRGRDRPRLEPLRASEALRLVAPSALWQMSIEPDRDLAGMRALVAAVPCFRLVLAEDRAANPALVEHALALASAT